MLVFFAVSAATASAGTYDVVACNATGANGVNTTPYAQFVLYGAAVTLEDRTAPSATLGGDLCPLRIRREDVFPYDLGYSRSVIVRVR